MPKKTLIEKLKTAGSDSEIAYSELMEEVIGFYKKKNSQGLKDFFDIFGEWALRNYKGQNSESETIEYVKTYLDSICGIADELLMARDKKDLSLRDLTFPEFPDVVIGPVRSFYRKVLDYHPVHEDLN